MSPENEVPVEPVKQSLVEKLAEACGTVGGIEKKGRNATQGYDYVKAADVAKAIRHELFKRGVVIIPRETEIIAKQIEFTNSRNETKQSNQVQVRVEYDITDGINTLTGAGYGIALDSGDKAIYKAKTGSLKYFLRGLGLIPDEKDDPEADESVDKAVRGKLKAENDEFDQTPERDKRITQEQAMTFMAACKKSGKTDAQVGAKLETFGYLQVGQIKRGQWLNAIKWANAVQSPDNPKEMVETIKDSVVSVKMRKLMAKAKEKNIPESDLNMYAYEAFSIKSKAEMTSVQLDRAIEWVEAQTA